jgi:hypothetical protein
MPPPPFSDYRHWEDEKDKYVQQSNDRGYDMVINNAKNLNRLKVELGPQPPAKAPTPVPTLEDFQKILAKSDQDRVNRQKERDRDKRQSDHDQRIARLEQDRDRKADEPRTLALPDAMVKWMEEQTKDNKGKRREREIDAAVDRRLLERQSQVNGITWGGNNNNAYGMNNGAYGNNWLPAPPRYS